MRKKLTKKKVNRKNVYKYTYIITLKYKQAMIVNYFCCFISV